MSMFDLTGRVAIVTGSTRGIGRAIAEEIASAGGKVVISSRNQSACDEVSSEINSRIGEGAAIGVAASISSKDALKNLVNETLSAFGRIDTLVCNAASNPYHGPLSGISDEAFRKTLENNILANHWLVTMVTPEMEKNGAGSITIISSIGGLIGSDVIGAYHISKAADFQLVRNLAVELGPKNIRVNAIAPGVTRTDFARALWEDPAAEASWGKRTPLGRIGEPSDMAGAAVFLASDASAYMTGNSIVIDGGMTIKG